MFDLGLPEILIILVAVAIFFSGGKRIAEWARNLGRFSGEFKRGKMEMEQELKDQLKKGETKTK